MKPLRIPGARLQALLDALVARAAIHHAVLAVATLDGSAHWAGAAGVADTQGTAMRPETPYFIASVDKLYTATAILRLHERGELDLDAPACAYLPAELTTRIHVMAGTDRSAGITVRHLLGHTSGLADWLEDRPAAGAPSLIERIAAGEDAPVGIVDALRMVREQLRPHFPPQDPRAARPKARYSDTNYLLLIAILETLCARRLEEIFAHWIFAPAGMRATGFLGVAPDLAPAALWFGDEAPDLTRTLVALRSVYSTASDQVASLRALLSGALFERPGTTALMQQRWTRFGLPRDRAALRAPGWPIAYGLGMMRFALPRVFTPWRPLPPVVGHTGSTGSWLFHCPAYDLLFAGTVDQANAGAVPFRTVVPRLLRAIADANRRR